MGLVYIYIYFRTAEKAEIIFYLVVNSLLKRKQQKSPSYAMYELSWINQLGRRAFWQSDFWLTSILAFYWDLAVVNLCLQNRIVFI